MKGFYGLAVFVFAAVAVAAATGPGPVVLARRHIAFNETYSVWLTAKEVEALTVDPNVHFMDITDFPSLGAVGSVGSDAPFPNQPMQKELVEAKIRNLDVANLEANLLALTNFYTRYYTSDTGVEAADWIYATLTSYAGARTDITVEYFTNTFPQPSVIARIAGTSDPDDRVILGSHIDSVGSTSTGRAPGADDDGSGTVCNLEVFRVLAQSTTFRPNKTLEFHFYAAEEAGLLGSQAIAQYYEKEGYTVRAMMQLDMTMWAGYSPPTHIGLVEDFVSKKMTDWVKLLVDTYSDLDWVATKCGYACSDHASWTKIGVDSCFPFEGTFAQRSPYIHSANDDLTHVTYAHGLEFAKIALGNLIELSFIDVDNN